MPSISFAFEDFCRLLGKKLSKEKFEELLPFAKAELDAFLSEEVEVDYNDTNQPYLWSAEGLSRLLRGILEVEKGLVKTPVKSSKEEVIVDKSVSKVRPFIASFTAKGPALDDYALKQLIQLQEKLCENFGRKRKKVSVGIYPADKIIFPIRYECVDPSTKFIPLESNLPMSLSKILEVHPKGVEYADILKGFKQYPVLKDNEDKILSFAPIINSDTTGKVTVGDSHLFFDATGTDFEAVNLVANIFALALIDRGFEIFSVSLKYLDNEVVTPQFKTSKVKFDKDLAERIIGIKLSEKAVKHHLERMRYGYSKGEVIVPSYRSDVMHVLDVIEDVAISFGYDNLEGLPLDVATIGGLLPHRRFIDIHRSLWTGLGYQEVYSAILSNKELLSERMCVDYLVVEVANFMSSTYSCVRSWILPILLDVLSKNKHVDYPQKLFEQGVVTNRDFIDEEHISAVCSHPDANYTELRQHVEFVLSSQNVEYKFEECSLPFFIPGRAARIVVNKKEIGFIGEIHPQVLVNFSIIMPVAGLELNLSLL